MSETQPREQDSQREPQSQADRQRQVEAMAEEYLEHLLAGEAPDRQAVLAAHSDLADLLEPRLALVELMHRVARAQHPAVGETGSLTPPGAPAERALRVKCPHCGNGIQLVEAADVEVTCGSCGSSFHVDPRATATYNRSALPKSIGKFEVLEQLGRGAFGTVYKARDPELQRLVAVKVPRTGSFATQEEEERFLREARAAAQLSHPGIVPVLEIAHDRGVPIIVSEYVEGLTLADLLTARRPGFRESAELAAAVADALDYAHRRHIVHRDVKPSNLLLDASGRPHISDFGLARGGEGEITVTLDGQILGTPAYMSPEQAAGDQQHVDARSDVYSLGVVLYELLTGELPFRGNQRMLLHQVIHDEPRPPRSLNDRVPRDLETICLKAMAKAPARRYASALEMADDLRSFLNGRPIQARRVARTEKLARWARRNPVVATLTAAVTILLLTATAVSISFALYQQQANHDLAEAKDNAERSQREAEVRAASAAVDLDLKHCEDGEIEYGVLRLARTLGNLPAHATELRQCVEMNLLAWAQEIPASGPPISLHVDIESASVIWAEEMWPLGPKFVFNGSESVWELSPDGRLVLTGGEDGTGRLWDAFTGEVIATLNGHRGKIVSVAFSQNGRVVMTVGQDRTVRLWATSDGKALGVTSECPEDIEKALLSPDGSRLLTLCHVRPNNDLDGEMAVVSLWKTATGKRISDLTGHVGHVCAGAYSPDGQTLMTGGMDKTARLWSADTGRALAVLQGHTGGVWRVAFSPEGDLAATLDCEYHTTDPGGGQNIYRVRWWDPHRFLQIGRPCLSPNGIGSDFRFIHRDVVAADVPYLAMEASVLLVRGMEIGIEMRNSPSKNCRADDEQLFDSAGKSYDRRSGKPHAVLPGRKFDAELARYATGRRFIDLAIRFERPPKWVLMDLLTEKAIGKPCACKGGLRYVPSRQTFIVQSWPSPRYIPLLSSPLAPDIARLFAEVVTCYELDPGGTTRPLSEDTWDERRRLLAERLKECAPPASISRVALDRWYWLRRKTDRAAGGIFGNYDDEIKHLDRLISVEPTWQNYQRRARRQFWLDCLGKVSKGASKPATYGRFKTSQGLDVHYPSFFPLWEYLLNSLPHGRGSVFCCYAGLSPNLPSRGERSVSHHLNPPLLG